MTRLVMLVDNARGDMDPYAHTVAACADTAAGHTWAEAAACSRVAAEAVAAIGLLPNRRRNVTATARWRRTGILNHSCRSRPILRGTWTAQ